MPITPQYTWDQTDDVIVVNILMKGFERAKVDVFATDCLLKVNAPPYLLQLELGGEVDSALTTATIDTSGITFKCPKRTPGAWSNLEVEGSKEDIAERRNRSIEEAHRRLAEAQERKKKAREQYERDMTARALEADKEKRQALERAKAEELGRARSEIDTWQRKVEGAGDGADTESEDEDLSQLLREPEPMPDHPDYHGRGWRASDQRKGQGEGTSREAKPTERSALVEEVGATEEGGKPRDKFIWIDEDEEGEAEAPRPKAEEQEREEESGDVAPVVVRPLPPPRRQVSEAVRIAFTPTEIAHMPAREKREVELKEYKRKNLDPAALDSHDVAERQPLFLKDKGDALFQAQNYEGALNAYSRALELDPDLVPCYSNRAACLLKLQRFPEAANDCTKTLELLRPDLEKLEKGEEIGPDRADRARKILVKAFVRRAACYGGVGHRLDALMDLERAHRLDRANAEVLAALTAARAALSLEDAARLRSCGDDCFRAKEVQRASECYSAVLSLGEEQVAVQERAAAYANRAACSFQDERFDLAARDCSSCLRLTLRMESEEADVGAVLQAMQAELASSSTPPTEQFPGLPVAVKALSRRAACRAHLRQYQKAMKDFEDVGTLQTLLGNATLAEAARADAEKMRKLAFD